MGTRMRTRTVRQAHTSMVQGAGVGVRVTVDGVGAGGGGLFHAEP